MAEGNKILTVSYGIFSCTLQGYEDPVPAVKTIAEYFRDLAASDRAFGAAPAIQDAAILQRIADREFQDEIQSRVEAKIMDKGVFLRPSQDGSGGGDASLPASLMTGESVAAKLQRIRAAVARTAAAAAAAPPIEEAIFAETEPGDAPRFFADSARADNAFGRDDAAAGTTVFDALRDDWNEIGTPAEDSSPSHVDAAAEAPVFDALRDDWNEIGTAAEDSPAAETGAELYNIFAAAGLRPSPDADARPEAADLTDMQEAVPAAGLIAVPLEEAAAFAEPDDEAALLTGPEAALPGVFDQQPNAPDDPAPDDPAPDDPAPDDPAPGAPPEPQAKIAAPDEARHDDEPGDPPAPPPSLGETADEIAADAPADTGTEHPEGTAALPNPHTETPDTVLPAGSDATGNEPPALETAERPVGEKLLRARARVIKVRRVATPTPGTEVAALRASTEANRDSEAMRRPEGEARTILATSSGGDRDVTRLLRQTDSQMGSAENRQRISTLAHLKAAVAATVAELRAPGSSAGPGKPGLRLEPYRNDLARAVTPEVDEDVLSGDSYPAPLLLDAEQRVDRPLLLEATPARVVPRRVNSGNYAVYADADEAVDLPEPGFSAAPSLSFRKFVERLGVRNPPELIEAAAAYTTCIESLPLFSRIHLLRHVATVADQTNLGRDENVQSFSQLLRQGKLTKVKRGHFTIAEGSYYLEEARRLAH